MIGAIRDVTRERAAQAVRREADELRRVLFGLPSPAMQVDAHGAYVDADEHALAFFERTREEMLARNVGDDFPRGRRREPSPAATRARGRRARGLVRGRRDRAPPAAQHRAHAHRRRAQLLPPGRGHHRAEGDAGGAGALRAGAAPPGDDPRRAQHGAQGPARAARAGPARARAADRLQRRAAHRADAGAPQPLVPAPAGAARDRRARGRTCGRSSGRSGSASREGGAVGPGADPPRDGRSPTSCAAGGRARRSPRRCT